MRTSTARRGAALLAFVLAGSGAVTAAATPTQPHWRVPVTIPASKQVADSDFAVTAARNDHNIWAVGSITTYTSQGYLQGDSLVEHFDGRQWRRHSAPPLPPGARGPAELTAVSTAKGAPLWVAGFAAFGRQAEQGGFVARWNGSRWIDHSFGRNLYVSHLAVIGPNNVWVLGSNERRNPETGFAARWNGRAWSSTMPLAALPTYEGDANVAASWAPAENAKTYAPELLHLYGDHWSLVPTPHVRRPKGTSGYRFNDVVEDRGAVLLTVGYDGDEAIAPGLSLYRRSGTAWRRIAFLPKEAPAGMARDNANGAWLLSGGATPTTHLLHVGPAGRVLRRVAPPQTSNGRMQIEGIARVPGTASLVAAGEFIRRENGWAAIGRYRP